MAMLDDIVIVEMTNPENCKHCPCREKKLCLIRGRKPIEGIDMEKEKPDWCPIFTFDKYVESLVGSVSDIAKIKGGKKKK